MNNHAALEALLFINGDPLSVTTIQAALGVSDKEANNLIDSLQKEYESNEDRGLRVILHDNAVQLVTHPRISAAVEELRESTAREALTPAALETLAVVSYRGPLPKSEIESIRGVNCGSIIRTLLLRGLIKRERNPNDKRTFLYRITEDFLKALGLSSEKELPDFSTLSDLETPSQ